VFSRVCQELERLCQWLQLEAEFVAATLQGVHELRQGHDDGVADKIYDSLVAIVERGYAGMAYMVRVKMCCHLSFADQSNSGFGFYSPPFVHRCVFQLVKINRWRSRTRMVCR